MMKNRAGKTENSSGSFGGYPAMQKSLGINMVLSPLIVPLFTYHRKIMTTIELYKYLLITFLKFYRMARIPFDFSMEFHSTGGVVEYKTHLYEIFVIVIQGN